MLHFLMILWYLSLAILTIYHLGVFRIRRTDSGNDQQGLLPGVSIVIAVKNGSDVLIKNLGSFLSQDYPTFEIIIVDDHSDPAEKYKLEEAVAGQPKISLHHADQPPGKKQALVLAIEKSKYELILCADADCKPAGPGWIKSMVGHGTGQELVLGYSPYRFSKGILNFIVRFETVMTGIQYLSWAMKGRPYMGVGRNMLYPRKLFLEANPYQHHQDIPYGDDDLWVQQASGLTGVKVNFEQSGQVYSDPPGSWRDWIRQKHRHLSAGHHYKRKNWWQPGLYALVLIMHWALIPLFIPFALDSAMFIFFLIGFSVRWDTYRQWTSRLGDRDTAVWYPLLEVGYALYLAGLGTMAVLAKKKTWN